MRYPCKNIITLKNIESFIIRKNYGEENETKDLYYDDDEEEEDSIIETEDEKDQDEQIQPDKYKYLCIQESDK